MPHRTAPVPTPNMPSGIPYIVGNEAAERFSFYGMRAILFAFMTTALMTHDGAKDLMSDAEASKWVHTFISAAYFTPILGALLADLWLGKYRTIILLSIVYCLGHLALAVDNTRTGLIVGMSLIAVGSGGIKPCVSAHVGDQFGATNAHLLPKIFNWFYFSINLGAAVSMLATPWLLEHTGPHVAFGVPGVLMLLATIIFWLGRNQFVHIPADPKSFARDLFQPKFLKNLGGLAFLYILIAAFWSVFDQTASRWVAQAEQMNRELWPGFEVLPSQLQSVNAIFVLSLIPIFTLLLYPFLEKFVRLTALRRIGAGFLVTAATLGVSMLIETWIAGGETPAIWWQILAYLLLTSAEILISITALEFSYTQAPLRLKSFIMGLYLLSVSLGNFFTARVNAYIEKTGDGGLEGADYYAFFLKVLLATFAVFLVTSFFYKEQRYIQEEELDQPDDASEAPNV
jgi:POT family proton-dependent oligopeptide transporter